MRRKSPATCTRSLPSPRSPDAQATTTAQALRQTDPIKFSSLPSRGCLGRSGIRRASGRSPLASPAPACLLGKVWCSPPHTWRSPRPAAAPANEAPARGKPCTPTPLCEGSQIVSTEALPDKIVLPLPATTSAQTIFTTAASTHTPCFARKTNDTGFVLRHADVRCVLPVPTTASHRPAPHRSASHR
jgi:hypothetical protein